MGADTRARKRSAAAAAIDLFSHALNLRAPHTSKLGGKIITRWVGQPSGQLTAANNVDGHADSPNTNTKLMGPN